MFISLFSLNFTLSTTFNDNKIKLEAKERLGLLSPVCVYFDFCPKTSEANLVPRSPTVRRKEDLVKFDLRPEYEPAHRAECPPAHNCDHSW